MCSVIVATARVALCGTRFLQFNFRGDSIANSLYLYSQNLIVQGGDAEVMHAINIVVFIRTQPALCARNSQLALKMDFSDGTLKSYFKAKSAINCIK